MRRGSVLAILLVLAVSASSAFAAPRTLPGWPRTAPAGQVFQGPGGGVVVVAFDGESTSSVAAYRRDGRRLWITRRGPLCGICTSVYQPTVQRPDGAYGPIGPGFWAVNARGGTAPSCGGLMLADRRCIQAPDSPRVGPTVGEWSAGVVSTVDPVGVRREWSVTDGRFYWQGDLGTRPVIVGGGEGLVYVAFSQPETFDGGGGPPGVLLAVDPTAHAIAWARSGPIEALAGLSSGVLVQEVGRIVALSAHGAERWSRPFEIRAGQAIVDAARDRLYVDTWPNSLVVRALSLASGATIWRTATSDKARLVAVGHGGRVYLAIDQQGHRSVRAVRFATGAIVWEYRTGAAVQGVRELENGTVAISTAPPGRLTPGPNGRLTVVDPR